MPSKYSHSVVLAQHSSRGLISLPNDQYAAYLNSSPLVTTTRPPYESNATFVRTWGSSQPGPQENNRQQPSFDQLSANASRTLSHNAPRHDRQRQVIVDPETEVDGGLASSGNDPELHRPGTTIQSSSAHAAPRRTHPPPQMQHTAVSAALAEVEDQAEMKQQTPKLEYSTARRPASASTSTSTSASASEPDAISAQVDLPRETGSFIGKPSCSSAAAPKVATAQIATSSRSTTPKLSSAGTNGSQQTAESPRTPLSDLPRFAPAAERWGRGGGIPVFPDQTEIQNHLPTTANFDYFSDECESNLGYLARVPGPQIALPEGHQPQIPPVIVLSRPTVQRQDSPSEVPALAPFHGFIDTQGSLSSLDDMGIPSLVRPTQKQQKSPVQDTSVHQPSSPDSPLRRDLDPSLLETGALSHRNATDINRSDAASLINEDFTLLQSLSPLENRVQDAEMTPDSELDAAVPPDILRHRNGNAVASSINMIEQLHFEQAGLQLSQDTVSSPVSETVIESGRRRLSKTPYAMVKKSGPFFGKVRGKS